MRDATLLQHDRSSLADGARGLVRLHRSDQPAAGRDRSSCATSACSATRHARPSAEDERSTIVAITNEVRTMLAKVFPGYIEAVKTHQFESLRAGDVETLARVMRQVSRHLRRGSGSTARSTSHDARFSEHGSRIEKPACGAV